MQPPKSSRDPRLVSIGPTGNGQELKEATQNPRLSQDLRHSTFQTGYIPLIISFGLRHQRNGDGSERIRSQTLHTGGRQELHLLYASSVLRLPERSLHETSRAPLHEGDL